MAIRLAQNESYFYDFTRVDEHTIDPTWTGSWVIKNLAGTTVKSGNMALSEDQLALQMRVLPSDTADLNGDYTLVATIVNVPLNFDKVVMAEVLTVTANVPTTRVTDADVKEILKTSVDTTPFITAAHVIVDDELLNSGLSETRLREIERYLAAHFACIRDPRLIQQKIGDAQETYEGFNNRNRSGLSSTSYGDQVQMLDSTGRLADLMKPKAGVQHIGTNVPPWGVTGVRG